MKKLLMLFAICATMIACNSNTTSPVADSIEPDSTVVDSIAIDSIVADTTDTVLIDTTNIDFD